MNIHYTFAIVSDFKEQYLQECFETLFHVIIIINETPFNVILPWQDFDHDIMVWHCDFTKDVVRGLLIIGFRRAIGPVMGPASKH